MHRSTVSRLVQSPLQLFEIQPLRLEHYPHGLDCWSAQRTPHEFVQLRACVNRDRPLVIRARIARSCGELSKLPCEGANPCPHSKHTLSSPSGNSSPRYCLKES